MKPSEQLADIERKEVVFREVIATSAAAAAEVAELKSQRLRLIGTAAADGVDPDCEALDKQISLSTKRANQLSPEAEKANAALTALGQKREALAPALADERKDEHKRRVMRALDRSDTAQAEILAHLNALVQPLGELIGAHRALEMLDARPGVDYGSRLYEKLRSVLDGPFHIDWPRQRKDSLELRRANEVYYELSGAPHPSPKAAKAEPQPVRVEIKGFHLPEALEDPSPELGWPESGATLTDWALAFAERGWAVSTCMKNRHGDIVPNTNIAGERGATTEPKRIRAWFDSPSVIAVGFFAAERLWIFDGHQVKKFAPVTYAGR